MPRRERSSRCRAPTTTSPRRPTPSTRAGRPRRGASATTCGAPWSARASRSTSTSGGTSISATGRSTPCWTCRSGRSGSRRLYRNDSGALVPRTREREGEREREREQEESVSPVTSRALDPILRRVSRTIFLTLRIAPSSTRRALGLAYLFCRAADTIADTRLLPPQSRIERLDAYRARFESDGAGTGVADLEDLARELGPAQAIAEERELLARLSECFREYSSLEAGDRGRIRKLVTTLVRGMEMDLRVFPPEESGRASALESEEDLDRYTYHVAGCVGEFFTDLHAAHVPALARWDLTAMRERGVLFGKALQMTNILRDVDRDLAIGRSYFPRPRLEAAGVTADELRSGRGGE